MAKRKKGKMPAGLKRYWAARRRKTTAKVSNPRKKRRSNPRPVYHAKKKRHSNPSRHMFRHHRRRSNPRFSIGGIGRQLTSQVMPALLGAGGAVAMDVALGYLPLPVALQTGLPKQGVRVAAALAIGFGASKVFGKAKGQAITQGALTIIAYDLVKQLVHRFAPTVPGLAGDFEEVNLGYMNPAPLLQDDGGAYMGAYMDNTVGAYMDQDGVGDF